MKNSVLQAEVITMKELNNLFIEMSAKSCTKRCKHCYISFPMYKKVDDFINIEVIKNALNDTMQENIRCIYLTGAEPMGHPDFNSILRLCLKRSNVCILTDGSFINEKKARFLKKVSEETSNEIIFKISLDHYDELKNDDVRYRGAFRQALFAVKSLVKYGFLPIITVTNFYNEPLESMQNNFVEMFRKFNLNLDNSHIQINPCHFKNNSDSNVIKHSSQKLDCECSRVLTAKGVYTCPFLSDDYRGRSGSSFQNYTPKCVLETDFCQTCLKSNHPMFSIDFSDFK